MGLKTAAVLFALALHACAERVEIPLFVFEANEVSALFVVEADTPQVVAVELVDALPPIVLEAAESPIRITALTFAEPLSVLTLDPGLQRLVGSEGRKLPVARARRTRVFSQGAWTDKPVPPSLTDIRIEQGRSPCTPYAIFESEFVPFPNTERPWFSSLYDETSALFGTIGAVYRVWIDGRIEALAGAPVAPSFLASASRLGDVDYFGSSEGDVLRGTLTASNLELETVTPTTSDRVSLDNLFAFEGDAGVEFIALDRRARLRHFADGAWITVAQLVEPSSIRSKWLTQIGPRRFFAMTLSDERIAVFDDGSISRDQPPSGTVAGYTRADASSGLGVIVAGGLGRFLRTPADSLSWTLEGEEAGVSVKSLLAFDDRFVFGAKKGLFAEYVVGHGFCDPVPLPSAITVDEILAFSGGRLMLAGDGSREVQMPGVDSDGVVLLRPPVSR